MRILSVRMGLATVVKVTPCSLTLQKVRGCKLLDPGSSSLSHIFGPVSAENLEKNLKQMERQLQQLEKDLETFPPAEEMHDNFAKYAKEHYQKLVIMHNNMGLLYQNLVQYFVIDSKKTTIEEFFTDISNFRSMFMQAVKENVKRREAEEKQRRVKMAKEKAEREKLERQQKKKRLLEMNAVCHGTVVHHESYPAVKVQNLHMVRTCLRETQLE
ncbi:DIAP3 protein, partial [Polypterus senegalus]